MIRNTRRRRAYAPDPDAPGQECDMPGCTRPGEYRAPKSRDNLRDYFWFCLEHVRAYNAAWDYYKGMSSAEIEANLRADTSWGRPSWPLGGAGRVTEAIEEELAAFAGFGHHARQGANAGSGDGQNAAERAPAELREALSVLGLQWPVTREAAKSRYKELAKRNHPDANGGDRVAEERLKSINVAYATLSRSLPAERAAEPTGA
jgi:hypothetical protein